MTQTDSLSPPVVPWPTACSMVNTAHRPLTSPKPIPPPAHWRLHHICFPRFLQSDLLWLQGAGLGPAPSPSAAERHHLVHGQKHQVPQPKYGQHDTGWSIWRYVLQAVTNSFTFFRIISFFWRSQWLLLTTQEQPSRCTGRSLFTSSTTKIQPITASLTKTWSSGWERQLSPTLRSSTEF